MAGAAKVRPDNIKRQLDAKNADQKDLDIAGKKKGAKDQPGAYVVNRFHVTGDAMSLVGRDVLGLLNEEEDDDPEMALETEVGSNDPKYAVLRRPVYLVNAGDTLIDIAERFYDDQSLAWLIADLNKGRIKDTRINGKRVVELMTRQRLVLPVWQDIVTFCADRTEEESGDRVVTVVVESQIDREVVDESLGVAVGASTNSEDPFGRKPAMPAHTVARSSNFGTPSPTPSLQALLQAGKSLQTLIGEIPSTVTKGMSTIQKDWSQFPPTGLTPVEDISIKK